MAEPVDDPRRGRTGVDMSVLKEIGGKLCDIPETFQAHRTIRRFIDNRKKAIDTGEGIDWAHFDTFAWRPTAKPGRPKGGDAYGLRAAWHMLQKRFETA